jgi:hypothetical protein
MAAHARPTTARSGGPARAAAVAAALALALAACSGGDPTPAGTSAASAPATPTAAPSPTPSPPAPDWSPYTGLPGGRGTPVLVVKLDNTPAAQPHRGLAKADIVYVEPVEWGLTRLGAVFSRRIPTTVGPVRSARVGDIDVFAPYGDVAFVYSGAQQRLRPQLAAADWTQVTPDLDSPGFHRERGTGRFAPFNLMAEPEVILATSGATAASADIGLLFDADPLVGGKAARRVTARWPSSSVQFRWSAGKDAYDVWIDGRQARDTDKPGVQRAASVIVQYVKQVDSGYGDKFGGRTPETITTGTGKGLLLRDGRAHPITWDKPTSAAPTAYLDADGQPVVLAPGQLWILLMDRTRKVTID